MEPGRAKALKRTSCRWRVTTHCSRGTEQSKGNSSRQGADDRLSLPSPRSNTNTMAFRRPSGVLGVPHALQFLDSNLPPDSIHFGRDGLGARSAICIGVLVMGIEHRPRSKQRRPAEPSLRVDENSDDMHWLLEEMPCCEGFWLNWISSSKRSLTQSNVAPVYARTATICGSARAAKVLAGA